jgi:hypothetical protein
MDVRTIFTAQAEEALEKFHDASRINERIWGGWIMLERAR